MESSNIEYTAKVVSPLVNGDAQLKITDKGLMLTGQFDTAEVPFAEMNKLSLYDYIVTLSAEGGDYVFSKLGNWCQPFYDALVEVYNEAVRRSLFEKGAPIVTVQGMYSFNEPDGSAAGAALAHVYDDCVVTMPPDLLARRVPLCFTIGMDKGDFELTLRLDTGESYSWAKLGYDTAPFTEAVEKQIRALREKTLAAIKEIDPTLDTGQASRLAKLVPHGAAATFSQMSGIAPSFTSALEKKIAATRASESYEFFKEVSDPVNIYIGFRKNEAVQEGGAEGIAAELPAMMPEGLTAITDGEAQSPDGTDAEVQEQDPYLIWLIAPSPDGQYAAVEFAEANTATFVYKTGGDFNSFAAKLNKALEAIDFKREVIRLTDEELRKPENSDYYMAAKRTAALKFIRSNFAGRVIHSSHDSWKNKLTGLWSGS